MSTTDESTVKERSTESEIRVPYCTKFTTDGEISPLYAIPVSTTWNFCDVSGVTSGPHSPHRAQSSVSPQRWAGTTNDQAPCTNLQPGFARTEHDFPPIILVHLGNTTRTHNRTRSHKARDAWFSDLTLPPDRLQHADYQSPKIVAWADDGKGHCALAVGCGAAKCLGPERRDPDHDKVRGLAGSPAQCRRGRECTLGHMRALGQRACAHASRAWGGPAACGAPFTAAAAARSRGIMSGAPPS